MSKFKFIKITKRKKIRYLSVNKYSKLFVVFLHGFMSDLEGSKPKAFMKFCKKKGIGFLGLEYSGSEKIDDQQVITDIFNTGRGKLEFLQATSPKSPIARFISKKGEGMHHIAL